MDEEMPDFTMGDLLEELAETFGIQAKEGQDDEGVYTSSELAKTLGVSKGTVLKGVKALHEEGRIEITQKAIKRFGGTLAVVQAYKLKPREKTDGAQD